MSNNSSDSRGTIQNVGGTIRRVPVGQSPGTLRTQGGPSVGNGEVMTPLGPPVSVSQALNLANEQASDLLPPTQMSWRPLTTPRRVTFLGTSFAAVHRALGEVFGGFPIRLSREHIVAIRAMATVAADGREPYDQIAEALAKHGDVEVGVE